MFVDHGPEVFRGVINYGLKTSEGNGWKAPVETSLVRAVWSTNPRLHPRSEGRRTSSMKLKKGFFAGVPPVPSMTTAAGH